VITNINETGTLPATNLQPVAYIVADTLERSTLATIVDWLDRVERDSELTRVPLSKEDRTGYVPRLIWDLAQRLRAQPKPGRKAASDAAMSHGKLRHSQGYSISMIVEESRILQVSIFETLYNRLGPELFRSVRSNSKIITDECDLQLKQTLASFTRRAQKVA